MADPPTTNLPPKKEVALALLEGESLLIHLDPRRPGVLVPKHHAKQAQLVLQIGLNLQIRIPDLTIDDEGVTCTLSFNRVPFWCRMPWASIYALVGPDGRGMLWPDDVPPEVAEQMRAGRSTKSGAGKRRSKASLREAGEPITEEVAADNPEVRARDLDGPRPAPRAVARPTLAAVPPSSDGRGPERGSDPRRDAPFGAHGKPKPRHPIARGAASPPAAARRPKRELPPYLRIVK
jgi:hypothetical protein